MDDQNNHWFFNSDHIKKFMSLSEKIGKMMLSVNEAMTRFAASDAFAKIVNFFQSLPNDIQETELFQHISSFMCKEISYDDIEWLQERFGYMTYEKAVDIIKKNPKPTPLDVYIFSVIDSANMGSREKIIVLLAHFEELIYQTMSYERKTKDRIKPVASQSAKNTHEMDVDSYKKILTAGIVFVIFSDTDKYTNAIDKRIPFRNNILHRGMLNYPDEEAKHAYELLICFIAQLVIMGAE